MPAAITWGVEASPFLLKLEAMLPAASPPVPPKAGETDTKTKDCGSKCGSDCTDCGSSCTGCPGK